MQLGSTITKRTTSTVLGSGRKSSGSSAPFGKGYQSSCTSSAMTCSRLPVLALLARLLVSSAHYELS